MIARAMASAGIAVSEERQVLNVQTESGPTVYLSSPGRQGSYSLGLSLLCARWLIRMLPQQREKQAGS